MQVSSTGEVSIGQEVETDSDVTFKSISGTLTGNAATVTKLASSVKIGGEDFDGSADIDLLE